MLAYTEYHGNEALTPPADVEEGFTEKAFFFNRSLFPKTLKYNLGNVYLIHQFFLNFNDEFISQKNLVFTCKSL